MKIFGFIEYLNFLYFLLNFYNLSLLSIYMTLYISI